MRQSNQPASTTHLKPLAISKRYLALDALRGLALFGVLLVNDLDFFRVSLFQQLLVFHSHPGWVNRMVDVLVAGVLEFKAITLFSFLFGVGIAIQYERFAAHATSAAQFLTRRFTVLLGIGLIHMFLISNVDILCLYAICGLLLIPFLRSSTVQLIALGLAAIGLALFSPFASMFPSEQMMYEHSVAATSVYSTGSYYEILVFRWHETWQMIVPLLIGVLPQTFGLILLGIAAWRARILQEPAAHRRLLIAIALGAGSVGAVATGLTVLQETSGQLVTESISPVLISASSYIPLAFCYASAFLLWMANRSGGKLIASVAALGQMSLTNYLVQSIILSLIFYGYGLGLFGRLAPAPAAAIGVIIYIGQVAFSQVWLRHYRFGPAEWVWRSLSYREWQPMRRVEASAVQPMDRDS